MSLGVGISDILFFVDQTLKLYGNCQGAPAELQAAGRDVEQMRTAVKMLGDAIGDRVSFVAKHAAVVSMIEHEMAPLKTDLIEMNAILAEYIDHSNMGMLGRLRYAVVDRSKLQGIRSNLMKSRTTLGLMLDLVNMKAHEQHARDGRVSGKKLDEILNKQNREAGTRKVEAKTRERSDAKLERILGILQQCFPEAADTCSMTEKDEGDQTDEILNKLEKELVKAGSSRNKARAARKSAAGALATHELPSKDSARTALPQISQSPLAPHESPMVTTGPSAESPAHPDNSFSSTSGPTAGVNPDSSTILQPSSRPSRQLAHGLSCDITGEDSPGKPAIVARGSSAHKSKSTSQETNTTMRDTPSSQVPELPRTSPGRSPSETKNYRILCVDSSHGVFAITAHAHLEHMRVWTANRTGRWLCKSISSAGCRVETHGAIENSPLLKQALDKLIPRGGSEWAHGIPNETNRIVGRMRTLERREITTTDLKTYDIVLCSNAADRDYVEHLKSTRTQKFGPNGLARVSALPYCEELSSMDCGNDSRKLNEVIAKIETGINEFISVELGKWSRFMKPTKIYRTRHVLFDRHLLNTYRPGRPLIGPEVQKIENETGCSIRIANIVPLSNMVLLSVNGPKETLMKAWILLCNKQHKAQPLPPKAEVPGTHVDASGSK